MAKLRVRVHRDDDLRNRLIEIWKGRKKVSIKQDYSPAGDTFEMAIEGRRELLPTVPELLEIVCGKRLDRIGTIELIDLITRIALIDEITTIGTIGEITTIRDLSWSPRSLIQNSMFSQDFAGWVTEDNVEIDEVAGVKSCKFSSGKEGNIMQKFSIPLDVSAWTEFYLYVDGGIGAKVDVYYWYSDDTNSSETVTQTKVGNEKLVLSPTAGKKIRMLKILHLASDAHDFWVKEVTTVF